ncbi:MAG: segregation/condensation protein A [Candidatus Andersenbacteria bacterium]|nr:segregation/condensation protein A [Candidatus Andersenbacteria bacterium]
MTKLSIKLEQFEGPYDLLLELVRQEKLDVSQISLAEVTGAFLDYLRAGKLEPSLVADFLVVASTLLLLKTRAALPAVTPDEEGEMTELTERVRMYELYRAQAEFFRRQWDRTPLLPAHAYGQPPVEQSDQQTYPFLTGEDMQGFFEYILVHLPKQVVPTAHFVVRGRTLQESLQLLHTRLGEVKRFFFHEEVGEAIPQDTAVSFLAALELARQRVVILHQDAHFAAISIEKI